MNDIRSFLDKIADGYGDAKFYWEIRLKPEGAPHIEFFESMDALHDYVTDNLPRFRDRRMHVWFGVLPRVAKEGTEDFVTCGTTLWLDMDGEGSADHFDEIRSRMAAQKLPPFAIVRTGQSGKCHVYFKLPRPLGLAEWKEAEHGLQNAAAEVLKEFKPDAIVCDPPRVLRMPGTPNWKYEPPSDAEIVFFDKDAMIGEEMLERTETAPVPEAAKPVIDGPKRPQHVMTDSLFRQIRDGTDEGGRHYARFQIARELFRNGFTQDEIKEHLLTFNGNCRPPDDKNEVKSHADRMFKRAEKYFEEKLDDKWVKEHGYGTKEDMKDRGVLLSTLMEKEMPRIDYWLEPLVPKGSIIIIGGRPGTFKSMMTLAMSLSMINGRPFVSQFYVTDKPTVLLYDLENGERLIHRRVKYLLGDGDRGLERMRILTDFNKHDIRSELLMALNYDVVILDSYRRFLQGEENASDVTDEFYRRFLKPLREAGKTVIIVHHFRKMRPDEELTDEYLLELFRGSSDLVAQVDTGYALIKSDEQYADKKRTFNITVGICKNRLSLPIKRFGISVEQDDETVRTMLSYQAAIKAVSATEQRRETVLDLLKDGEKDRKTILNHFSIVFPSLSIPTIDRLLRDLEDLGRIKNIRTGVYAIV